jgi:hypothetical protein
MRIFKRCKFSVASLGIEFGACEDGCDSEGTMCCCKGSHCQVVLFSLRVNQRKHPSASPALITEEALRMRVIEKYFNATKAMICHRLLS